MGTNQYLKQFNYLNTQFSSLFSSTVFALINNMNTRQYLSELQIHIITMNSCMLKRILMIFETYKQCHTRVPPLESYLVIIFRAKYHFPNNEISKGHVTLEAFSRFVSKLVFQCIPYGKPKPTSV